MASDASVNFINNSDQAVRIKPRAGKGYEWDAFNLFDNPVWLAPFAQSDEFASADYIKKEDRTYCRR